MKNIMGNTSFGKWPVKATSTVYYIHKTTLNDKILFFFFVFVCVEQVSPKNSSSQLSIPWSYQCSLVFWKHVKNRCLRTWFYSKCEPNMHYSWNTFLDFLFLKKLLLMIKNIYSQRLYNVKITFSAELLK